MCKEIQFYEVENGPSCLEQNKGFYIDEAISKTKFGCFNYILIFVGGLILTAVFLETCGIVFVLPVATCDLNLTTSDKGILSAVPFLGIICSSHLWGFLADTKGRRRVIRPTLFVAFMISIVSSFAPNFYQFAILRFFNGFFISGCSAIIYAYLGEFHSTTHRSRAILASSVVYGVLCMLMPLIAWAVINEDWEFYVPFIDITYKPWRLYVIACSMPGFLSFLIISFLIPESPKFVLGQGNQAEVYRILQKMNRINNGRNSKLEIFEIFEEAESIENRQRILESKNSRFPFCKTIWLQTVPLFKSTHLFSTFLICLLQFTVYATTNGFYMFTADILNKMANNLDDFTHTRMMMCDIINMKSVKNNETNSLGNGNVCIAKLEDETIEQSLANEILYTTLCLLITLSVSRIGKFPILFAALVVPGVCGILCMIIDIPIVQVIALTVLMLSAVSPIVISAATVEIYPTSVRAIAVCISLMMGRLGTVVGANTVASMLDNHCETVFYLSGTSLIGAGLLTFFIPKIHQRIIKSEAESNGNV